MFWLFRNVWYAIPLEGTALTEALFPSKDFSGAIFPKEWVPGNSNGRDIYYGPSN